MIFVTVGSQMPFDRLIVAMDAWAAAQPNPINIFAQIGSSSYRPTTLRWNQSLTPGEFKEAVSTADIIVAHAGMGSVLTAMEMGKSLVLMPRLGDLQETRNDHQIATAKWLAKRDGIFVAMDETELPLALAKAITAAQRTVTIAPYASPTLIDAIKKFVG